MSLSFLKRKCYWIRETKFISEYNEDRWSKQRKTKRKKKKKLSATSKCFCMKQQIENTTTEPQRNIINNTIMIYKLNILYITPTIITIRNCIVIWRTSFLSLHAKRSEKISVTKMQQMALILLVYSLFFIRTKPSIFACIC